MLVKSAGVRYELDLVAHTTGSEYGFGDRSIECPIRPDFDLCQ